MSLDAVLNVEPKNTKALFRKGKCLEGLGKDEESFECLRVANALLDPQNTLISQDLAKIKSRLSASQKKEKEMYGKMFQLNKKENTTSNDTQVLARIKSRLSATKREKEMERERDFNERWFNYRNETWK